MNAATEDRYANFEVLDEKTRKYAEAQTRKFRRKFSPESRKYLQEIKRLSGMRKLTQVRICAGHVFLLTSDSSGMKLTMDGKILYRTKKIISWFEAGRKGKNVALYETSGSDLGTLVIFENGKITEKINDYVGGIVFTEKGNLLIKEFRGDDTPAGIEKNSSRVLMDGHIVFGQGLKSDEFISIKDFDGSCAVVTGNYLHSSIYTGKTDDPSSWKLRFSFEMPSSVVGIVRDKLCILLRDGNGKILLNDKVLIEAPYPLEEAHVVEDGIILVTLKDAKVFLILYNFDGNFLKEMELEEPSGLIGSDSDGSKAVFAMQSFSSPMIYYTYEKGKLSLVNKVRNGRLDVREDFADSDGVKIHYFHISARKSRHNRALVYGYGGFNISMTPVFYPLFAFLLKRGIDVIYCNLRGGGEYGEEWHRAGMKQNKINVFNDFKAVIMKIRSEGYGVVIWGVSNGGLLTSHALVTIPELLSGAVIGNPVIDMMKYHRLLAGSYWVNEYGNPDDPEDKKFLIEYSPYHARLRTRYPPTLIYTRMNDDRVHPAHALKFYAKIKQSGVDIYLRADPSGGHIGISFSKRARETSDIAAFILHCFNIPS